MRKGWRKLKLGEFCEIRQGKNLAISQLSSGEFPVFGANGIVGFYDDFNFSSEVVALGCRGSCGTVHLVNESAWLANNVMAVWPKNKNLAVCKFVALLLETADLKSSGVISGQVQPQITRTSLSPLSCLLPPLEEQKRIVDVVSSVDACIDALQQQADTARTARNAVLHELLSAGGDDWTEIALGEIADFVRGPFGGSLKKEIFVPEGFAVYEQQHAIYGDFGDFRYFVNQKKFDEMKRFSVSPGDLLMSCSGTIGKVALVPAVAPVGIINQALLKISTSSQVLAEFLLYWTQSEIFRLLIAENSGGAVQQNVASVKLLKDIKINLPSLTKQKRIVEIVSSMDDVIQSTEQAVADAKNLRSGLLSDLLSGEHEIPAPYDVFVGAA